MPSLGSDPSRLALQASAITISAKVAYKQNIQVRFLSDSQQCVLCHYSAATVFGQTSNQIILFKIYKRETFCYYVRTRRTNFTHFDWDYSLVYFHAPCLYRLSASDYSRVAAFVISFLIFSKLPLFPGPPTGSELYPKTFLGNIRHHKAFYTLYLLYVVLILGGPESNQLFSRNYHLGRAKERFLKAFCHIHYHPTKLFLFSCQETLFYNLKEIIIRNNNKCSLLLQ